MGGKIYYSHGTSAARGIALLVRKELAQNISNVLTSLDGRYILWDIEYQELKVSLAAIYAPNEDRPEYFDEIACKMRERSEHKVILGDFNLTIDVGIDRLNTYSNNSKARDKVLELMEEFYLKDIWRVQYPEKREYSWFKGSGRTRKASRIDFVLLSSGLDQQVEMIQYLSSIKTDHRAVYMVVAFNQVERGSGYWKLNTSLLQNQEYLSVMNKELDSTLVSSIEKDPTERWEIIKKRIKEVTVKFSRKNVSEEKLIIGQLSEKVNEYEERLPLVEEEDRIYMNTKEELEDKLFERVKGVMFRSKANWYEYGEKSTKYFLSLEKAKYNAKTCYKLKDEDGREIEDQSQILEMQRQYYEKLYEEDKYVEFSLENTSSIRVPEEIKIEQDQKLTLEELGVAVKMMKNNKTPGDDGIPIDFYKVFWAKLKDVFLEVVEHCSNQEVLHTSARRGILNLIPKPNKDSTFIKNLRPITLLNTDYKIIEKAIANKMVPALEHIIHQDQRGFMKERRISVNIRKMLDIIHLAAEEDIEGVILSLDFVKCFDKCSFKILHGSLEFFGFGEIVKHWTRILYKDFSVQVQNNGFFSEMIKVEKGVHQGGCCSSVYFLVIAEILAMALRDNQNIQGLTVRDIKNLLNQFADDMDIFSICNQGSIKAIYEELDRFKYQSGFTVSYDKTTLYRIGSLRFSDATMYGLTQFVWSNKDINVLGVTIAHNDMVSKNYENIVTKARNILNCWENRKLTLIGKIQVVNSLVASLLVYKMMVLPIIPEVICKNLDNMIREYIWEGKKSKISYRILQNAKREGGLNLVNIRKKDIALKASWPLILEQEENYANLVYSIMRMKTIKADIWRCSLHPKDVNKMGIQNEFWRDVLQSWCTFNYYYLRRTDNQLIWYNSEIRIKGKPFFWRDVYIRGLKYVFQLFENNQFKSFDQVQHEYGLTRLRFNSLKAAIPKEWKMFFLSHQPMISYMPVMMHNFDCFKVQGAKVSSMVYKYLQDDRMLLHNKFMKWYQELGEDVFGGVSGYAQSHCDIYSVTNITKFRSFQYRLMQRALVTNIQLYEWKVVSSRLCSFCGEEPETVIHMFCDCWAIQDIWHQFKEYVLDRFNTEVSLRRDHILFNRVTKGKGNVANFLCLVTKQYIYKQRCLKKPLATRDIMHFYRQIEQIEKYIACKQDKLNVHRKKWASNL